MRRPSTWDLAFSNPDPFTAAQPLLHAADMEELAVRKGN